MGVLRWLEAKCFLGEVVRDYGVIDETQVGIARTRVSVLLCRRGGEPSFVIKESALAWLGSAFATRNFAASHCSSSNGRWMMRSCG